MYQLKRQHSAASLAGSSRRESPNTTGATPASSTFSTTPPTATSAPAGTTSAAQETQQQPNTVNGEFIGSPLKKQRPSVSQADETSVRRRMESGLSKQISEVLGSGDNSGGAASDSKGGPLGPPLNEGLQSPKTINPPENVDEEL